MKLLTAIAGGLAGACTLTLLHQAIKKADKKAPHVDELGMEALSKSMNNAGMQPPQGEKLYNWTLTGDIIANTMYYSLGAIGKTSGATSRTTALGLLGGLGAVYLPEPLHLTKEFTNRTPRTKFLTVGLYTIGGIVAGSVMRLLSLNSDKIEKKAKKIVKNVKAEASKTSETVKSTAKDLKDDAMSLAKDIKAEGKQLKKGAKKLSAELLN